jgi:hypothetical protein
MDTTLLKLMAGQKTIEENTKKGRRGDGVESAEYPR